MTFIPTILEIYSFLFTRNALNLFLPNKFTSSYFNYEDEETFSKPEYNISYSCHFFIHCRTNLGKFSTKLFLFFFYLHAYFCRVNSFAMRNDCEMENLDTTIRFPWFSYFDIFITLSDLSNAITLFYQHDKEV